MIAHLLLVVIVAAIVTILGAVMIGAFIAWVIELVTVGVLVLLNKD